MTKKKDTKNKSLKKDSKLHSIKFSPSTDESLEKMRILPEYKRSMTGIVEFLVENNPAFIAFLKSQSNKSK